ncbi:hypothetical protein TraAM80_08161 [Trypanosoma rangeli]|uniref:Uncharacterized protein n=1 Tax=Trypanosoma rangeli TaxID=5698 RepID=A0A3R7RC02_TRYRA|nr:uncharacterized protein TraAM80_08161 [Trypanosoma rangeli]RNE99469.1 hypothetical protein TraAM80_08161 [Trypanosoma rangeli]|eukprot:RNE99469.1 hypothetical protein TraAM80_08161 [Trypanosoma rangeli]
MVLCGSSACFADDLIFSFQRCRVGEQRECFLFFILSSSTPQPSTATDGNNDTLQCRRDSGGCGAHRAKLRSPIMRPSLFRSCSHMASSGGIFYNFLFFGFMTFSVSLLVGSLRRWGRWGRLPFRVLGITVFVGIGHAAVARRGRISRSGEDVPSVA